MEKAFFLSCIENYAQTVAQENAREPCYFATREGKEDLTNIAFYVGANLPHMIPTRGRDACFAGFNRVPLVEKRGLKTDKEGSGEL